MSHPRVTGTIHAIGETKEFGQRGFRKRVVVLTQPDGRFMNYIPVELIQDDCSMADEFEVGQEVEVTYRLSGREWRPDDQSEPKYFLSANVVDMRALTEEPGARPDVDGPDRGDDPGPDDPGPEGVDRDDDIPF